MFPSLALLELSSIARAAVVLDALTKQARVRIERSEATTPGKFLILFSGDEAECEEAFAKGISVAGPVLLDRLLLPQAHPALLPLVNGGQYGFSPDESLLIEEYDHVAAALHALDAALKSAYVEGKKLHAARGIGGKAYFIVSGSLDAVDAAKDAAAAVSAPGRLLASEVIARVSPDISIEML